MTTVRVTPNPDRSARVLYRAEDRTLGAEYVRIDGPTDVTPKLAARLLKRGDVVETDDTTADEASAADFDPGGYSVPVVVAYLEDHPELVEQVVAAEQAGKARKGILDLVE